MRNKKKLVSKTRTLRARVTCTTITGGLVGRQDVYIRVPSDVDPGTGLGGFFFMVEILQALVDEI